MEWIRAALIASLAWAGCGDNATPGPVGPDELSIPLGFPAPKIPEDNPVTADKIELGRFLFHDTILSGNRTQACASCHLQERSFAEPMPVSEGSTGEMTPRNSMQLVNVAYNSTYTWHNPIVRTLEQQIPLPLLGEAPIELGMTEEELEERLEADDMYRQMFGVAFPDEPITTENAVKALATFVRTMISGNSPFDKLTYQGDRDAMSDSAKRGSTLFFSETLECHHCHGGFNLSQATTFVGQEFLENGFFNTGLYNVDGDGAYPQPNVGLVEFSGNDRDRGKFKVPTLRNITMTAPYLHDGSAATIDDVIDIYAAGGRQVTTGPNAGDGRSNPHKSGFVTGFPLSAGERGDVKAFLESLTDEEFLADPRFANPFE